MKSSSSAKQVRYMLCLMDMLVSKQLIIVS